MRKQIEDWHQIGPDRHGLLRAEDYIDWGGEVRIGIRKLPIVKYTPCGVWVSECGHERFVNLRSVKQFASANEEEALDQLKHRKRRQVKILESRLGVARQALTMLIDGNFEPMERY